ncbi:NADP-dependent oxidoreductase domain-containing protein [Mycena rosella]|uniref:NADP-dependent oxidoreductase domain-containing protein n=1 Tax=Mycena rosella TaxID=1033263 RepID=A0AAD7MB40_MYCRO|nr:NADP-dependent oxidoreductase domain-containing protein [Mycena rosella]
MHVSVEASLRKLRTTYIDILYIHRWDWDSGIEKVMNGLYNLVIQGKVLYLGISDTPAWVVSQANQYARDHCKTPFAIYQGAWSILDRAFEREIIPMARANGLHLVNEEEKRKETGDKGRTLSAFKPKRNEEQRKMVQALEKVAQEVGAKSVHAVVIAYVMQKVPYCFPIIGGRKIENLMSKVEALDISLSHAQIKYLESILPFDPGFPHTMIGDGKEYRILTAVFEKRLFLEPIWPSKD